MVLLLLKIFTKSIVEVVLLWTISRHPVFNNIQHLCNVIVTLSVNKSAHNLILNYLMVSSKQNL